MRPAADSLWVRLSPTQRAVGLIAMASILASLGIVQRDLGRAVVGLFGFAVFLVVAISSRTLAISTIVGWLVLLGFIRRLLIPFAGWSSHDPLLLVGPAAALVLWATAYHNDRRPAPLRPLTALALFLLLWTIGEIFNPNEPSISTGAQGALFYIGPLLWLFAGRRFSAAERQRVLDTVFWMTLPVLALGYYQTFVGLLPFDLHWVGVSGVGPAIFLPGFKIRPFSTLVSPQEYGVFLSYSLAIIWSKFLYARRNRGWLVLMFVACAVALFYQASRETFSLFLVAFLVVNLSRARSVVLSLMAVSVVGLGALLLLSGSAAKGSSAAVQSGSSITSPTSAPNQGAGVLANHELAFFSNPTGGTTALHVLLIQEAMDRSVNHPFGLGPSTGNLAGQRGGQTAQSAEVDFANVAQGLGLPAEVAFWSLVIAAFTAAYRVQRVQPNSIHLAWLGILAGGFLQWMSGGLYCTSAVSGMVLGGLTTSSEEVARMPTAPEAAPRRVLAEITPP